MMMMMMMMMLISDDYNIKEEFDLLDIITTHSTDVFV